MWVFALISGPLRKERRPRRRSLTAAATSRFRLRRTASPVLRTCSTLSHFVPSLAAAALELLLGNLNNKLNQLNSKISDHKAAAGAVRRRRKRLVAAGCRRECTRAVSKPEGLAIARVCVVCVFSKGVQSRKKNSIIYSLDCQFDNTFNVL